MTKKFLAVLILNVIAVYVVATWWQMYTFSQRLLTTSGDTYEELVEEKKENIDACDCMLKGWLMRTSAVKSTFTMVIAISILSLSIGMMSYKVFWLMKYYYFITIKKKCRHLTVAEIRLLSKRIQKAYKNFAEWPWPWAI